MIIALAGHVDHGKTSLVRALTGIETDRLKEEQERGLTIDLGFAYCDLGGQRVGFVDVPGHHRFVHNMLAGIAPSQLALLVVAADDGVMPQTREHLRILKLLGITRGLVALTKVDRANASQQQQASDGIRALTAGTFLEASPVLSVSSQSGAGIDALREALANQIAQAPQISSATIARLPIDRSFSQRGSGTIVSGTLRDGTLALEDRLWLFPGSQQTRVRSLHVNGSAATVARSGDRCAINLAGIELSQAHRGSWLTSEPMAEVQRLVIDYLQLDDRPLKHWSQVHAYHATTHAIAHAAVLDATRAIASGEQALIQLELNTPLLARAGDRIILRDHGQDRTLGGGTVVDHAEDQARRRELQRVTRFRDRATHPDPSTAFVRELEQGPVDAERFQARWGLCRTELESLTESAAADAQELNGWWVTTKQLKAHQQQALRRFNEQSRSDARPLAAEAFLSDTPTALRAPILKALLKAGAIEVRSNGYVRPQEGVTLTPAETKLLNQLTPHLKETPPPSLGDIAKRERLTLDRLKPTLKALAGKKQLVLMENNRALLPEDFQRLATLATSLGTFTVKAFRDASGLGRNLVITILETMDARGFTRRNGDERTVVGSLDRLR